MGFVGWREARPPFLSFVPALQTLRKLRVGLYSSCSILHYLYLEMLVNVKLDVSREKELPFKVAYLISFYRPRREVSEGYVFTGVCHSVSKWGGGGRC